MRSCIIRSLITTLFMFTSLNAMAMRAPHYVASVPPLASLLGGLLRNIQPAELLLDGQISPHTYALKPSDIKKIQNADLVFWVGSGYEFFLKKVLQAHDCQNYSVLKSSGLLALTPRYHDHSHSHALDGYEHHHDHGNIDPHVWLDPVNALAITAGMRDILIRHDPRHKQHYLDNFRRIEQQLQQLHQTIQTLMKPYKDRPFLVFHDGYQYFEQAYGLRNVGIFAVHPEHSLSVQHVDRLVKRVEGHNVRCVFAENQFKPAIINKFASDHKLIVKTLDPLGVVNKGDETDYVAMMMNLAQSFADCFHDANLQ